MHRTLQIRETRETGSNVWRKIIFSNFALKMADRGGEQKRDWC